MGRQELLDPLDLPAPREREESRDSPVHTDSRVCPDPLARPEREASPETRVFLERAELLVPLDPEASEGSLEREELLVLKVCRVLEVCLEPPELTDPREQLDLLEEEAPRDPPVYKACPEKEEGQASQDRRETGEMLGRKDLKELLVKTVQEV